MGGHWRDIVLGPDGKATACKPVVVGSLPTGTSNYLKLGSIAET